MPRINAPTLAEHVAQQEAAVIDAARRLFGAHGVRHVSLGDIADEVGLRRTSLYRYFPTKAHLVQRWFQLTMAPLIESSREAVETPGTPTARLDRWLDVQLDFMLDDEHAALVAASDELDNLPADVREQIGTQHRALYATLTPLLHGSAELAHIRILLVAGLVRSAADLARSGAAREVVRTELRRTARATLQLS
jgi:AcrR family transcriptional regulator